MSMTMLTHHDIQLSVFPAHGWIRGCACLWWRYGMCQSADLTCAGGTVHSQNHPEISLLIWIGCHQDNAW